MSIRAAKSTSIKLAWTEARATRCSWLRPRGGTWVNFCWVCAAGLSEPLTVIDLESNCTEIQNKKMFLIVISLILSLLQLIVIRNSF